MQGKIFAVIVATTGEDRKQLPEGVAVDEDEDALTCSVTMGNYASGMPALTHAHVCQRNNIMLLTHCTHTHSRKAN